MLGTFVKALEEHASLSDEAKAALLCLSARRRQLQSGEEYTPELSLIETGFLVSLHRLPNGRRAVTGLHVAGDHLMRSGPIGTTVALTKSIVFSLDIVQVKSLAARHPTLLDALWRMTSAENERLTRWLISIGYLDARGRTIQFFWDLVRRLRTGCTQSSPELRLPLTQSDLADALGLSVVHVNRTLKQLRSEGLIEFRSRQVKVNEKALEAAAAW